MHWHRVTKVPYAAAMEPFAPTRSAALSQTFLSARSPWSLIHNEAAYCFTEQMRTWCKVATCLELWPAGCRLPAGVCLSNYMASVLLIAQRLSINHTHPQWVGNSFYSVTYNCFGSRKNCYQRYFNSQQTFLSGSCLAVNYYVIHLILLLKTLYTLFYKIIMIFFNMDISMNINHVIIQVKVYYTKKHKPKHLCLGVSTCCLMIFETWVY